jgi:hypothetical protein
MPTQTQKLRNLKKSKFQKVKQVRKALTTSTKHSEINKIQQAIKQATPKLTKV